MAIESAFVVSVRIETEKFGPTYSLTRFSYSGRIWNVDTEAGLCLDL